MATKGKKRVHHTASESAGESLVPQDGTRFDGNTLTSLRMFLDTPDGVFASTEWALREAVREQRLSSVKSVEAEKDSGLRSLQSALVENRQAVLALLKQGAEFGDSEEAPLDDELDCPEFEDDDEFNAWLMEAARTPGAPFGRRVFINRFHDLLCEREELLSACLNLLNREQSRNLVISELKACSRILKHVRDAIANEPLGALILIRLFVMVQIQEGIQFEHDIAALEGKPGFDNPGKPEIKGKITTHNLKQAESLDPQQPPTERQEEVSAVRDELSAAELVIDGREMSKADFMDAVERAFDLAKFRAEGAIRGIRVGGITLELRVETTDLREELAALVAAGVPSGGEFYNRRTNRDETALEFFNRIYGRFYEAGILYKDMLRTMDRSLVAGLNKLKDHAPEIPTVRERTVKRVAKLIEQDPGLGGVIAKKYNVL